MCENKLYNNEKLKKVSNSYDVKLYPTKLFNEADNEYEQGLYGIASQTFMRGLIFSICDKFKRPVVIMQKRDVIDTIDCEKCEEKRYDQFCKQGNYSRLESTMFYDHWAVLCKTIREKENRNHCCRQDEAVANYLLENLSNLKNGEQVSITDEVIGFVTKENTVNPHMCIKYRCKHSNYDELAINVNVNGIQGVIIIGQFLFKNSSDDQKTYLSKTIKKYFGENERQNKDLYKNLASEYEKTDSETIEEAFKCVINLENALIKEYEKKIENSIRDIQERIVSKFSNTYHMKIVNSDFRYNNGIDMCDKKYEYLKNALGGALKELSNILDKNDSEEIYYYLPEGLYFESEYSLHSCAQPSCNMYEKTISIKLSLSTYAYLYEDKWNNLENGYLMYKQTLDLHEKKYICIIINNAICDGSIRKLISGFLQFVCLEISQLCEQYNGIQMTLYTQIMRHELGQLNEAILLRINTFEECVGNQIEDDYTYGFLQECGHCIEDYRSHAHSTMLRCNSSRYFTMLPKANKELFYPYESFLYKWKYIFEKAAENAQIKFAMKSVTHSDSSRPRMYADKSMIEQVAYNLTNNALKYSLSGTTISVDCKLNDTEDFYQIIVTNFGKKIKENEKERIFHYGYRGSNQNEASGSGLGLYLSRKIAERHNGRLEVYTEKVSDYDVSCLFLYGDMPDKFIDSNVKSAIDSEIERLKRTVYINEISKPQFGNNAFTPFYIRKHLLTGTVKYKFVLSIPYNKRHGGQ